MARTIKIFGSILLISMKKERKNTVTKHLEETKNGRFLEQNTDFNWTTVMWKAWFKKKWRKKAVKNEHLRRKIG